MALGKVILHRAFTYITASGAAFFRKMSCIDEHCSHYNTPQYTTFYDSEDNWHLSTLPIWTYFDDIRYKNKKPVLSNNNYIAVES